MGAGAEGSCGCTYVCSGERAKARSWHADPSLCLCMLRKGKLSKSTAEGSGYMNAKDKEQYRDTIKMLSRDL